MIILGKTIKSDEKEQRQWRELQKQKKAYLERVQEEEDANKLLKNWKRTIKDEEDGESIRELR